MITITHKSVTQYQLIFQPYLCQHLSSWFSATIDLLSSIPLQATHQICMCLVLMYPHCCKWWFSNWVDFHLVQVTLATSRPIQYVFHLSHTLGSSLHLL